MFKLDNNHEVFIFRIIRVTWNKSQIFNEHNFPSRFLMIFSIIWIISAFLKSFVVKSIIQIVFVNELFSSLGFNWLKMELIKLRRH